MVFWGLLLIMIPFLTLGFFVKSWIGHLVCNVLNLTSEVSI